ncbi:hypothetical protein C3495_06885 [Clostridiaceae bacterium 14S0207]|nr:hypothetical protein C3495_06885 [Clostridiaceae bacterium 14S0207]
MINFCKKGDFISKKVIIIGAGIGGLSLGIRLLNQGFNVKILEKQNYIGGKLGILKNENFIFDLTASLIMIPKSYLQLFQDINEDYRNYLNIIQLDPIYKVFFTNNRSYNFSIKLPKLAETLECFSNKDMEGYLHFLSKIYKKYYIADKFFLNNLFINNKKLLDSKYIEQVLYIYPFSSAYNNILKYIKNKDLANYLAFQTMYVGISPFNGSSIYIYSPSRIDSSMCKSGYECLNVVLRIPNLSFTNIKWDEKTILYFVGDSIHPNAGVSMVLNSSKIASEEIFKDYLTNYK